MGVLGGVLGLALIGGLAFIILRRKRSKAAEGEATMTDVKVTDTTEHLPEFPGSAGAYKVILSPLFAPLHLFSSISLRGAVISCSIVVFLLFLTNFLYSWNYIYRKLAGSERPIGDIEKATCERNTRTESRRDTEQEEESGGN